MPKTISVIKNEFFRFFTTPLAAVYLIAFLMLNGSFAIYFGHFFERGQANLSTMFAYQPWLYLLFIPGISMRLWSEEFKSKTIIQILTLPVSLSSLVWGKFIASCLFYLMALGLTFPFWITVNILGSPDNNIILISYFGSFLLACAMLSLSQTMSALSKSPVISLVLAVIVNLIFLLSGLEFVLSFFRQFLPETLVNMIASFSFINHFSHITQGTINLSDLLYFISLIILFNFTTQLIISFKTNGSAPWLQTTSPLAHLLAFLALLFIFMGINLYTDSALRKISLDVTQNKYFTINKTTKDIIKNLSSPITAKLYYSKILEQKNPVFRDAFNQTQQLLSNLTTQHPDKFQLQILHPAPLNEAEDFALAADLRPITIFDTNENAFFGIVFTDETDNKRTIPFLALEKQNQLELEIAEKLYELNHSKNKLGIITSLAIFAEELNGVVTSEWKLVEKLRQFYQVKKISNADDIKEQDILLIIHPQTLSKEILQAIKEFSYAGKGVALFLDPAAESPQLYAPATSKPLPSQVDFFEKIWNFNFSQNAVIADIENSTYVNSGSEKQSKISQDIIQFYINNQGINYNIPITSQLQQMLIISGGALRTEKGNIPTSFTPLLQSTSLSALMSANVARDAMHPDNIITYFKPDNNIKTFAALIESKDKNIPFKVVVAADTDFLYDSFWMTSGTIGTYTYDIPLTDNINFVLNSLEYLQNTNGLIALRGANIIRHPFKKLELQNKLAAQNYQIKAKEIEKKISLTKSNIQEIWAKKDFENRETFTPDELAIISNIHKGLNKLRFELLQIKEEQNKHVKSLSDRVKFFNIFAIPLIILFVMLVTSLRKHKKIKTEKLSIKRPLVLLLISGICVFIIGMGTNYIQQQKYTPQYLNKPLFNNLSSKINDIEQIEFKGHSQHLTFYKKDGIWFLQDYPHFAVYQKRIRSFLSALLEAQHFEKKSSSAAHLGKFGLFPIDNPQSAAVSVTLKDAHGKNIEQFDIGKYDIDLGRGTKAAYIRFPNKFQVWLAKIDLIDISLDKTDWTYAHAWDLRLGRIEKNYITENTDNLTYLVRDLLNTSFINATEHLPKKQKISSKKLTIEGGEKITIFLWKADDKYYLSYSFPQQIKQYNLAFFASYAKNIYYEISKEKADILTHAFNKR